MNRLLLPAGIGLAVLIALIIQPISQRLTTVGLTRPLSSIAKIHGHELKFISGTPQCEDVHHHLPSDTLFLACQFDGLAARQKWFPGLGEYTDPFGAREGGIVVVDPKTFKSTRLNLVGFSGPFVTHGIDIFSDPNEADTLHIFAINEISNPKHFINPKTVNKDEKKWRCQIEIFKHTLGSDTATWQRTVRHDLIDLPNDLYAISPTSFYATNDHHYGEGLMRQLEDTLEQNTAPWSNTVLVQLHETDTKEPERGFSISTALRGIHNNNGLGHGAPSRPEEVLITDASGGVLHRAQRSENDSTIDLVEAIQLDCTIDNPSWYEDIYATETGSDASGYIIAGLARAVDLGRYHDPQVKHPTMVWSVRPVGGIHATAQVVKKWEKKLIFQDDGRTLNTASAAVIVGIDPSENGGKKQGWLFSTGFMSEAMVATKIDL